MKYVPLIGGNKYYGTFWCATGAAIKKGFLSKDQQQKRSIEMDMVLKMKTLTVLLVTFIPKLKNPSTTGIFFVFQHYLKCTLEQKRLFIKKQYEKYILSQHFYHLRRY